MLAPGPEARQEALLLLGRPMAHEDRADDRRRDEQREQRAADRAELLLDDRELEDPEPADARALL